MPDRAFFQRIGAAMRCRRGASAAEFALVLPLLLTMLIGTLQVGMLMYSYNMMFSAARDATRAMAVCSKTDSPSVKTMVMANLPPWVAAGDWTVSMVWGTTVSTTISVDPGKAAVIAWIPLGIGQLTTTSTMRKEPLAFGGGAC